MIKRHRHDVNTYNIVEVDDLSKKALLHISTERRQYSILRATTTTVTEACWFRGRAPSMGGSALFGRCHLRHIVLDTMDAISEEEALFRFHLDG